MSTDLLKSLLLKAKDQYESANRWSYIIILICLIFHLMTFSQFISVKKKQNGVLTTKDHYIYMKQLASEIKTELDSLNNIIKMPMNRRTNTLLTDLKRDFDSLDRSIAEIDTNLTAQFTSTNADYLLNRSLTTNMSMQMPVSQIQSSNKAFVIDDELKDRIKEASDPEDLRELLLPVIEAQIIDKRFSELNDYWHNEEVAKIKNKTKNIKLIIDENKLLQSGEGILWKEILDSMDKLDQVSAVHKFIPPQDPYWWATVSGKISSLSSIRDEALKEFQSAIQDSNVIDSLTKKMREVLSKQKELESSLKETMRKIQADFKNYQDKLTNLNKTFGIISLDLNYIVPLFPLILGLVLSIQTFWCAYRLRELIGTAVLIEERDPERTTSKLIYLWSGVLLKKSLENENSKHKLSDQSLITKNHFQKRKRLRLVIYWIWIVIAVAQLAGLKDFSYYQVVIYGILGCFLVLFAQMYQWRAKSMSIYH